jgi:Kef-type K+ transport system membrane component KefB/mannitol/fructose-specific phosphotransferase system IIA component (Ntr-type)
MMFLALQIGIILFAARIGGSIATKLKMPSILGELAAGIIIGPWALGGIGFGNGIFKYGLFHGAALKEINTVDVIGNGVEQLKYMFGTFGGKLQVVLNGNTVTTQVIYDAVSPALYGIATLASIILLFLSGLETNLKMFLKYSFVGSLVGVGGVVVSFIFGDLCAVYLLPEFFENMKIANELTALANESIIKAMMHPAALFMGIMSTATSVGITARILSERKKLDTEEGTTIMAGAVIDDVLGLIVLAIGTGIIEASSGSNGSSDNMEWSKIGWVALQAFGVWLGATIIGIIAARKIAKFLKYVFRSPISIAVMAFGLSLILAAFFECMGLAMIIGAYVMGLALSRTDLKHTIQEMLTPVYSFLVPVFFCVMGMMVDLSKLCSQNILIFGAIYTVLAVAAKVIGCMLPSLCCGFTMMGSLRIGAGMVPRGEVALIIAGLGLSSGYLTQEVFGIGIMMTLITTMVAPPALVTLFSRNVKGVRHPKKSMDGSREVEFTLGSADVADLMLTKLVAEFRNEGFFTSLLSKEGSIWSVAMDDMELSIRRDGNKIKVECTPAEEAMVMTAWMEVASEMNDLARQISKPIRHESMENILSEDPVAVKSGHSNVGRYLQGFVMLPKFRASSKREAIERIVAEIAKAAPNHVKNVETATAAVLKREDSMPTGLDHGIAVPHGRSSDVVGIAGAVAILDNEGTANGCIPDYETIDNSQLNIIVLTLANSEAQTPYLQLMSFISRSLRADDGYLKLAECKTAEEMRKFFRSIKG